MPPQPHPPLPLPFHDWIPELQLGRAQRPGFNLEDNLVPAEAVQDWIRAVKARGVRSVVCLLSGPELNWYAHLPGGLAGAYEEAGLATVCLPISLDSPHFLSEEELARLDEAWRRLPRPMVVHCSAGQVRSRAAVTHLARQARAHPGKKAAPAKPARRRPSHRS